MCNTAVTRSQSRRQASRLLHIPNEMKNMIFQFASLAPAAMLHYDLDDDGNGQFYKEHLPGFTAALELIENHDPGEGALDPALLKLQNQIEKALAGHYSHYLDEDFLLIPISRSTWSMSKYVRRFWGNLPLAINTIRLRKGIYIKRFLEAIGYEGQQAVRKIIFDIRAPNDAKALKKIYKLRGLRHLAIQISHQQFSRIRRGRKWAGLGELPKILRKRRNKLAFLQTYKISCLSGCPNCETCDILRQRELADRWA